MWESNGCPKRGSPPMRGRGLKPIELSGKDENEMGRPPCGGVD